MGKQKYGEFHTNLMDTGQEHAWFSAVNPRLGLLVAYVWRRSDYPWLGVWEENRARKTPPWNGKAVARGMEFSNTPFPIGFRKAVDQGTFQGQKTFAWLPARGKVVCEYSFFAAHIRRDCSGVDGIFPSKKGYKVQVLIAGGQKGKSDVMTVG
jgi:hypothetical protein